MAGGRVEPEVIVRVLDATVMVRTLVAVPGVGVVASVTLAVKVNVPAAEGVPVMAPVEALRLRPPGSAPVLTDQV